MQGTAIRFAVCCLLFASPAWAEEDAVSQPSTDAIAHSRESAARAWDTGRIDEALAAYEAAYAQSAAPRDLYNIGVCHDELHHSVAAVEALEQALDEARDIPAALRRDAEKRIAEQAPKIGRLLLVNVPPGAEVAVDGKLKTRLPPRGVPLLPGRHEVKISQIGYAPVVHSADVVAAASVTLDVRLVPILPPPPGPENPPGGTPVPPQLTARQKTGFALLGLAVAASAVTAGYGADAWNVKRDYAAHCYRFPEAQGCPPYSNTANHYDLSQGVAIAGALLSGASLVAGIVLLVPRPRGTDRTAPRASASLHLECGEGPGQIGLACGTSF